MLLYIGRGGTHGALPLTGELAGWCPLLSLSPGRHLRVRNNVSMCAWALTVYQSCGIYHAPVLTWLLKVREVPKSVPSARLPHYSLGVGQGTAFHIAKVVTAFDSI